MSRPSSGDLWGGLSSAVVVLPQAMAFGATLWALFGGDVGSGALAGLIAAAALSLTSGIMGGTQGLVSSPTGPTLVLMGGTMVALQASGVPLETLPKLLVVLLLLAGLFQLLIGITNSGHLIKFIPYPVVAGFMTGAAFLMIHSQLQPIFGAELSNVASDWKLVPLLTTIVTLVTMILIPRWLPSIPGSVAGLICGIAAFYLFSVIVPGDIVPAWLIGQLPGPDSIRFSVPTDVFSDIPWAILVPASMALAVIASLDTLLTALVADVTSGSRHNARKEMIGQGLGQMLSSIFGGTGGAGNTGATVIAVNSGGRRWVGIISGVVIVVLVLFVGPVATYLPISVLAGIILHVAIFGMMERDILAWIRARRTLLDGGIAILVTVVTVTYDLMVAVAVGVVIAIFQFVHAQIIAPVKRIRITEKQRPSLRRRTDSARELLVENGDRIIIYELQGNLFFGTVDRLFNEMSVDLESKSWVILDMRRVARVDLTAAKMFQQMGARLASNGGELIFATVHAEMGLGDDISSTLRKISPSGKPIEIKTFIDVDESLEYAEDALLTSLGEPPQMPDQKVALNEIELFRDLSEQQLPGLQAVLEVRTYSAGEELFHIGDMGDELFIVIRGEVDAILPLSGQHYKRLATFGPGTFFGEVSFLQSGSRTANAKVTHDSELYVLDQKGFEQLQKNNPPAAIVILTALGRALSEHLRWADVELQRMID